jgi:hypothetical protein
VDKIVARSAHGRSSILSAEILLIPSIFDVFVACLGYMGLSVKEKSWGWAVVLRKNHDR